MLHTECLQDLIIFFQAKKIMKEETKNEENIKEEHELGSYEARTLMRTPTRTPDMTRHWHEHIANYNADSDTGSEADTWHEHVDTVNVKKHRTPKPLPKLLESKQKILWGLFNYFTWRHGWSQDCWCFWLLYLDLGCCSKAASSIWFMC